MASRAKKYFAKLKCEYLQRNGIIKVSLKFVIRMLLSLCILRMNDKIAQMLVLINQKLAFNLLQILFQ